MALTSEELARAHARFLQGETVRAIAADAGVTYLALRGQLRRRYGSAPDRDRPLAPLAPHLQARADQGVAGLRNWREDDAGQDGLDRLIARIGAHDQRRAA